MQTPTGRDVGESADVGGRNDAGVGILRDKKNRQTDRTDAQRQGCLVIRGGGIQKKKRNHTTQRQTDGTEDDASGRSKMKANKSKNQ
jgi:hypothetical protein